MSSVRINTLFLFFPQTDLYPKGMHCNGMHSPFCYAELELAWKTMFSNPQGNLWRPVVVLPINDWTPLVFPPLLFCVPRCVLRDPAKGRTNMELREKFILADGASQGMAAFRPRGRRSRPSSRGASPNRSTSVSSPAGQAASPQVYATSTPKVGLGWEMFSSPTAIRVLSILLNVSGP